MRRSFLTLLLPLAGVAALTTAAVTKPAQGFNIFSVDQDIALGAQVAHQTDSLYRAKGQLMSRSGNARAYQLLDGVVKRVLDNGQLKYRTQFPWDVQLIKGRRHAERLCHARWPHLRVYGPGEVPRQRERAGGRTGPRNRPC